jgi:four helix bundle protein
LKIVELNKLKMNLYTSIEEKLLVIEESLSGYNEGKDFLSLDAWKKAREVKLFFYKKIIPALPDEEKFNLDIQTRKASVSSTSNIAEGYGRYYYKESIRFYRIARGSLFELKDDLITCFDLDFINQATFEEGLRLIEEAKRMLNGYIRYTANHKPGSES